jgi:two-component system NtrC family sensor kinase
LIAWIRYNPAMMPAPARKESIVDRLEKIMRKYHLPLMPVIWTITCLIIAGAVLLGWQDYNFAEKSMTRQFNSQQLMLVEQAARGMEEFLNDVRQTTALSARLPEIQNVLDNPEAGNKPEQILKGILKHYHNKAKFLFLADSAGRRLAVYPKVSPEGNFAAEFNFRSLVQEVDRKGKIVVKNVIRRKEPGSTGGGTRSDWVVMAVPVGRAPGIKGILGCGLDFQEIYERYVQPIGSASSGSWMINEEGRFIAYYDPDFLGKDAFTARRERDPHLRYDRIDRIMKNDMLAGKAGMDEYLSSGYTKKRGQMKKLIAYAPVRIEDRIWSVALVVPYSEVTQGVWGRFKTSAGLIGIMIVTLLSGTYIGHKINQGRIRAEEKVRWGEEIVRSQSRLQALFDGALDAITIVERDYRISMVNKTGLNWYHRPLEDFVGKYCYQEFQGRSETCPNCPAEETFQTGRPAFRQKASLVAGGHKYYLQLLTIPLLDRNGKVTQVVEYVKDVTAERELQQQIIQSERLAVVGRMAANVAHEVKNPLGTIFLNADLLEEELDRFTKEDTSESRELLKGIKAELDRLIGVVEEYLQFARLPQVKLTKGNVNGVISDLLAFLREEIAERHLTVVKELDPAVPAVQLDPKQFRQALLNIIKNAFEAMPGEGKLTVSTSQRDGKVEIVIADTGKGISQEHLDLVFTPFFSTKFGGTGLGLSITSHIIQEHKGTISVESHGGRGTAFLIRLPSMAGQNLPLQEVSAAGKAP